MLDITQSHIVSEWKHDRPLVSCRFDPLGRYVFCGAEDSGLHRFQLSDGAKTTLTGGHDTWVWDMEFSPDGAHTISAAADGKLVWWETAAETPQPVRSVQAHDGWVRRVSLSPNGELLATGGNDCMVRLWNSADGALVREFKGHERHVYSAIFHPSGEWILSGDLMGRLIQWDVATGAIVREFDAKAFHSFHTSQLVDFGGVRGLAVSPDGTTLAAGGLHKATNPLGVIHEPFVQLFNWETQEIARTQVADGIPSGVIWRLRYLADGTLVGVTSGHSGGILLFWKADADQPVHRFAFPKLSREMDLHPDGLQIATAHSDGMVRITRMTAKAPA